MNKLFSFFLLLSATIAQAQEMVISQPDSVYKNRGVKLRKWYAGPNKKLISTAYYNKEGAIIKYQREPLATGEQLSTHYIYNRRGELAAMVDSIHFKEPDMKRIEEMKRRGLMVEVPDREKKFRTSHYKIWQNKGKLEKINSYHPDGSLNNVKVFEYGGAMEITYWYKKNEIFRYDTTEYDDFTFQKTRFYGCETNKAYSPCWDYRYEYEFDENGILLKTLVYSDDILEEKYSYIYHRNGLLTEIRGIRSQEFFEYEFYE